MAELADAPDLGSGGRPCRFESCYPHGLKVMETLINTKVSITFCYWSNWLQLVSFFIDI